MESDSEFVQRLQYVLQFLTDNGFEKAASAVYEQLESKTDDEPSHSAPDYAAEEPEACPEDEYRSRSADPVLEASRGASEAADDAEDTQTHSPWPPGAAEALQTRLSGSSRLYEDPDVDEYSSMEDLGYARRSIPNQQEFIMSQLDFLRTNDDDCYFHSSSLQCANSSSLHRADSGASCSNSSSASLSSPGMSSCAQHQETSSSPQQQHGLQQQDGQEEEGLDLAAAGRLSSTAAVTGDAAWDSGPAGITFAEPVTTPTKDSQRSSISDLKPSLSRVESLSNSFIEEFESVDGGHGGAEGMSRQESEAGSIAGDFESQPGRSGTGRSSSDAGGTSGQGRVMSSDACNDVIDLSPPSPPPDCAADAGIDLSNIFELGLRASSRTSSVDVLQGSARCWSEPDSDALFGQQQQLDTGRSWSYSSQPGQSGGNNSNSSSRAGSSLGMASLGGPGGLLLKPRQSAGASRLQSSSQHDPEQDPVLALVPPQQQQQQQDLPEQQQEPAAQVKQQQEHADDGLLVLSPTQEQPEQQAACQLKQQQEQQQQRTVLVSDSGSSSSAAGPGTPTGFATPPIAAAAGGSDGSAAAEADVDAAAGPAADVGADAAATATAATGAAAAAASEESPSSPPAAAGTAAGSGGGGGGFGFSFPTTPPSAVDAAVHEERAERVFSTWASNHSRSLSGALDFEAAAAAAGEDSEADTSSSKPPGDSTPGTAAAAAAASDSGMRSSSTDGPAQITLAAPVSPAESPFLNGASLAVGSKSSSPAGKTSSRCGSRAHSSSSAAARAAAAGGSSRSSSRRLSAAGRQQQQQQQQQQQAPGASSSGGARSPLGEGAAATGVATGLQASSLLQQQGSAGYDALGNALIPALDTDAESTGGFSGSGELAAPRYVIDEAGNLLYEYDSAYIENRYEMFDLRVIHRRRRTGFEDSKEFPIRKNDLIAGRYQVMDFLGSAAFSQAVQALDTATGALVCLKIIKNNKDYFDQSLDEIKLLRYVNNADPDDEHHIVRLYDFFYYKEHLILVCELLRANLYEFQKYQRENGDDPYFTPPRMQRIAIQVLQSLAFLHSLGLVHSDLKPENILIKSYSRCEVKVIDLGSSCFITDHLSSYVQSRSYRAPEVILGLPYGQKIDIWSLGCILAELATGYVLFQNDSLATLLARLEGILGPLPNWMVVQGRYSNRYYTRNRQLYERSKANGRYEVLLPKHTSLRHRVPAADEGFLDFLSYLLTPDPSARPGATEALLHPWLSYPYPPVEQIPD